jgi:hypothetical protein
MNCTGTRTKTRKKKQKDIDISVGFRSMRNNAEGEEVVN